MNRGTSYSIKNTISVPSASTAITIDVPSVVQEPETPPSMLLPFSPRLTPFGTLRKPMDFTSSLKASLSKGPESLAAALDGVLALHHRLEELRHQKNEKLPQLDRNSLTLNPTDLGQIAYM